MIFETCGNHFETTQEGDETKLLEGATSEPRRWSFGLVLLASCGVLAMLVGAVAANDAMHVGEEKVQEVKVVQGGDDSRETN